MIEVIIRNDVFDESKDAIYQTDDLPKFLSQQFKSWPSTARVYTGECFGDDELVLSTDKDVEKLSTLTGTVYIVLYPAGMMAAGIALIGATFAISRLTGKKKSKSRAVSQKQTAQTPNNNLSARSNSQRIDARVPEIYGTVRSIPDLLMQPYTVYGFNTEQRYSYLCIGRGSYDVSDIKDGLSLISSLNGAQVEVYGPGTSPVAGSPQLVIGGAITEPLTAMTFAKDVSNASMALGNDMVGPYVLTKGANDKIILNISASGIVENGTLVPQKRIKYKIVVFELNSSGNRTGNSSTTPDLLLWYVASGATPRITYTFYSAYTDLEVEVTRLSSPTDPASSDTLTLDSLATGKTQFPDDFGDVTTIYTSTLATSDTSNVEESQLNCLAQRKVPIVQSGGTVGADAGSNRFIDILAGMALDSRVGNRQVDELDLVNFLDTYTEALAYFGDVQACEFSYTFDDLDTSFEEMFSIVCEAVFCSAYRTGDLLKLFFEKETLSSTLLLNHRNKLPNSESRTVSFGSQNDHDGVEIEYVLRDKGEPARYYLPIDRSAVNPDRINILGVQNKLQAYFHAHRLFAKQQYQNTVTEFDATHETNILKLNERVLIADNTRQETFDGEVLSQDGTTLALSQDVTLDPLKSYVIFIQTISGVTETIAITQSVAGNTVVLDNLPSSPLSVDPLNEVRALYEIVLSDSSRKRAFLIEELSPRDNFLNTLKCVNYDDRYYANDSDFLNNVVDSDGELI